VRIRKENPANREAIDVGSLRIRMSTQTTDPVIQVIDGNEQDVGTWRVLCKQISLQADKQQKKRFLDSHGCSCY
jgi:hypothetical protein